MIDNRTVINNHLTRNRGGKISFTHLIGWAMVQALQDFYEHAVFVRVGAELPRVKDVAASNFAQLSGVAHGNSVAVMCAIDNLVAALAGQRPPNLLNPAVLGT